MAHPTYTSLAEREAGREALFEMEASKRAEIKAADLIQRDEEKIRNEQDNLRKIAQAEQRGVEIGSEAGKMDAARTFTEMGLVPASIFGQLQQEYQMIQSMDELNNNGGLGGSDQLANVSVEQQVDKLSNELLSKAMNGAGDEEINAFLDNIPASNNIKLNAARSFLDKKNSVPELNQGNQIQLENPLPGTAVERMKSPITSNAQNILGETDSLIQRLHEKLSGQQPQVG